MIEVEKNKSISVAVICPIISDKELLLSEKSRLEEAVGLAQAINLNIMHSECVHIRKIKASTYFSNGFIERISPVIKDMKIELIIVDTSLSPIQQRNLERQLKAKVIDRTALILEIFGERAQTKEGVLQVELAHLTYQRSRLVRSWTHLERQRGGAGFLGGPGETQIELDRRIIDDKIIRIKKDLEKVKKTRDIQRTSRDKVPYPVVALVGYTNAGKSSLFNLLTQSHVTAADMLFATLDPTLRKIILPGGKAAILSDTVGFISDLPHELIMAFRATLEEVCHAAVILHVRDISNPDNDNQKNDVIKVLSGLGLEEIQHRPNYIEVLNKADLLSKEERQYFQQKIKNDSDKVLVSSLTGSGKSELLHLIEDKLSLYEDSYQIKFPLHNGKIPAWLYDHGSVTLDYSDEKQRIIELKLSPKNLNRLESEYQDIVRIKKIQTF